MILDIKNTDITGGWEDLLQYLPKDTFDAKRRDVSGPNSDTAINGDEIRDVIAKKITLSFVTRYITNTQAKHLEALMGEDSFKIRTDYFEGTALAPTEYEVCTDEIGKTYVHRYAGDDWVKLSATIRQVTV